MTCEIQSESDFLSGSSVSVRIPEDELDKKALYTIQAERPEFILPFHYRRVDGQVEFVYQIGAQSKLQYLSGNRSAREYALLWSGILTPLLECGDWFMKPYSFVLSVEYLYYDKEKKKVCYLYIPSIADCSENGSIKDMAADVARYISTADAGIENNVLRAIMKDFNPKDFLRMLEQSVNAVSAPAASWASPEQPASPEQDKAPSRPAQSAAREQPAARPEEAPAPEFNWIGSRESMSSSSADIVIDFPSDNKSARKIREGFVSGFNSRGKRGKDVKSLRNDGTPQAAGTGSAAPDKRAGTPYASPSASGADGAATGPSTPAVCQSHPAADDTQSIPITKNGCRLRLAGSVLLPPVIEVDITAGEIFTIGRFDAAVGNRQSSFEFDKKTKAVSRRHAAIERDEDKYSIIDLSSSAGTYLDGRKLPPNTPCDLSYGCRVSFGNAGCDYVWEE